MSIQSAFARKVPFIRSLSGIGREEDNKAKCESERVKAVASLQRLTELMAPGY